MLSAHRLLDGIITSLRTVIAPAIADPYPKAQAYMAAVILEFVARDAEARRDIAIEKERALDGLFRDLSVVLGGERVPASDDGDHEARLCRLIEWLYAERESLGPAVFSAANTRIRQALRQLLDQELRVAGKDQG